MATPLWVCKLTNRNSWLSLGRQFPLSCGEIMAGATLATLSRKHCLSIVFPSLSNLSFGSLPWSLSHITHDVSLLALQATPCCYISVWAGCSPWLQLSCSTKAHWGQQAADAKTQQRSCKIPRRSSTQLLFWTFVNFLCSVCLPKIMVLHVSAVTIIFLRSRWKWTVILKKKGQKETSGDLNHYAEPSRKFSKLKITSHTQAAKYLYFLFLLALQTKYSSCPSGKDTTDERTVRAQCYLPECSPVWKAKQGWGKLQWSKCNLWHRSPSHPTFCLPKEETWHGTYKCDI